jgi:TM2 domain-containing membrane protein YozV
LFHTLSLQLSFLRQPKFALLAAIFCGRPVPLFLSFFNTTSSLFNQRKKGAKIPKQVFAAYLFIVLHTPAIAYRCRNK